MLSQATALQKEEKSLYKKICDATATGLQYASASPFSNRVPDERAVQGLSPSKGFFFTSRGIRDEEPQGGNIFARHLAAHQRIWN